MNLLFATLSSEISVWTLPVHNLDKAKDLPRTEVSRSGCAVYTGLDIRRTFGYRYEYASTINWKTLIVPLVVLVVLVVLPTFPWMGFGECPEGSYDNVPPVSYVSVWHSLCGGYSFKAKFGYVKTF